MTFLQVIIQIDDPASESTRREILERNKKKNGLHMPRLLISWLIRDNNIESYFAPSPLSTTLSLKFLRSFEVRLLKDTSNSFRVR